MRTGRLAIHRLYNREVSKSFPLVKMGVIFLLFMSAIAGWHLLNDRPSSMDETKHMQLALDYRDWIVHDVPLQNPWDHVYPPLYHFSIIPALSLGVPTEAKAVMTHALYVVIFLVGCLLLGRAHRRSDDESLAAGLLTLGYCYVLWAARRALIDFPLLTWATLTMALLARTRGFSSRKASLWWAVAAGVGMLLKFTFAFFFILPVLWTFCRSREPGRLRNGILAAAVAAVVGGSWYFWNSAFFFDKASGLVNEVTVSAGDPHTVAGWLFYIKQWPSQMGIPNMLFTALGLIFVAGSGVVAERKGDGLLWMWFLSGYLILSAMMNKDMRHTLPMLPALAFLAVRGWGALFPDAWRARFLWPVVAILFGYTVFTYDRPAKENWPQGEIGRLLERTHDASQPFLSASVLSHQPRFFARGLKWSLRAQNITLKTTGAGTPDSGFVEYIFLRQGGERGGSEDVDEEWRGTQPQSRAFRTLFHSIAQYPLVDGSNVMVYQRDPHPHFDVKPLSNAAVAERLTHTLRRWVQGPLTIQVEATPAGLREGHLEKITARCEGCQVQGVTVQSAQLVMVKPWINLYSLWDMDRIGLLAFESVGTHLVVTADEAAAPLSRIQGVKDAQVDFSDGRIHVGARIHGIPVRAVARAEIILTGHPCARATLETVSIAGIPLPGWIIGKASRQTLWLDPQPSFPGRVAVSRISLEHNQLVLE